VSDCDDCHREGPCVRHSAEQAAELARLRAQLAAADALREAVGAYGCLHVVGCADHVAGHIFCSCNACDMLIEPDGSGHQETCALLAYDRARRGGA
jgi:hypothetical protein